MIDIVFCFIFGDSGFSNTDDVSSQASNVSKLSAMSVYCKLKLDMKSGYTCSVKLHK